MGRAKEKSARQLEREAVRRETVAARLITNSLDGLYSLELLAASYCEPWEREATEAIVAARRAADAIRRAVRRREPTADTGLRVWRPDDDPPPGSTSVRAA